MEGWVQLHRQLLDSDIWKCETFTRGQAWVDLIMLANHKDSYFYKRGTKVDVKRGSLARSIKELSDRWTWSRSKVSKFLNDLEKEQQIVHQKNNVTTVIELLNYDNFQGKDTKKSSKRSSKTTPNVTPKEQQNDTYNNDKNDKNENNVKKIPVYEDFLNHAVSKVKDVDKQAVKLKFDSWVENDWKDGNDSPIKNWKSKLTNTVQYLPKNKIKDPCKITF